MKYLDCFMDYESNLKKDIEIFQYENLQDEYYKPEHRNVFDVKSYWLDMKDLHYFYSETVLLNNFIDFKRKKVLFLIHPESSSFYQDKIDDSEPGPIFKGRSTSSSRTLLVYSKDDPSLIFFAKLSLDKFVSGVVRTIPKGEVTRSIGTTKILDFLKMKEVLPKRFEYFREVVGIIPKDMERGGCIIREVHPELFRSAEIMPCFSLYTKQKDTLNLCSFPLHILYKKYQKGETFEDFVSRSFISPFIKQYLELAILGISTESHGQNLIVKFDGESFIFYYRDFGGFNIDLKYIKEKYDYPIDTLPCITNIHEDYFQDKHDESLQQCFNKYFYTGIIWEIFQLNKKEYSYHLLISRLVYKYLDNYNNNFEIYIKNYIEDKRKFV